VRCCDTRRKPGALFAAYRSDMARPTDRRLTGAVLGVLAGLALAACGTTVPLTSTTTTQGLGGEAAPGAGGVQPVVPGATVAPGGIGGPATSGSTNVNQPGTTGAAAPRATVGALAPGGPVGSARGVTATTFSLGVYTVQAFSKVTAGAGLNIATGDQEAQARAVIDYLNARGGIAGRRIVPVFHDFDVGRAATDVNSEYEAACSSFTQDHKVYAVATPVGTLNDTFYACLAKAGVISSATADTKDAAFFRQYADTFYMPAETSTTRTLANAIQPMHAAGWFGKTPKIGVVRTDTIEDERAVNQGLKPALSAVGLKVDEEFAAPVTGDSSSAYSAAVLKFQAEDITHVIFTALGSPIAFGSTAQAQQYYPKYGLNSRNGPASVLQAAMSPQQLKGSMGYGWQPLNDVDAAHDPGIVSARAKECRSIMAKADQDLSTRSVASVALWICDAIFFVRDSLAQAPDFTLAGFRAGAERLGRYHPASTFASLIAPGRLHDGASSYRLFSFKDDCSCFVYTTPVRPAP